MEVRHGLGPQRPIGSLSPAGPDKYDEPVPRCAEERVPRTARKPGSLGRTLTVRSSRPKIQTILNANHIAMTLD